MDRSLLHSIERTNDHPREPPRVLLIEDDDDFRALVGETLRALGYDVIEEPDSIFALSHLQRLEREGIERLPDIIVSDVRMPCIDGLDLVRLLREAGWPMPVVLMSGFTDAALEARILGMGTTVVLDKPFPMSRLRDVVAKYVNPSI